MIGQPRKVDRRITKTKKAITKAFRELFLEASFDAITVTAIANRADIDRKTFYSHYASMDDLLKEMGAAFVEKVTGDLGPRQATKMGLEAYLHTLIENITKELSEDLAIRRQMAHGLSNEAILRYLTGPTREHMHAINELLEQGDRLSPAQLDLLVQFYLGGAITVYKTWLENGMEGSLDDASEMVYRCSLNGLRALLDD